MKSVYAVLVNWNRPNDTLISVDSLLASVRNFELKIVIVDNGSEDNSVNLFKTKYLTNKRVKIIEAKKNLGFTGGNNLGIDYSLKSRADYILVINNDVEVDKNMIKYLLQIFDADSDVGIASPKIYFAPGFEFHKKYTKSQIGHVFWYAGGNIDWNNVYGTNRGVDEVDFGQYDKSIEIDFATGACMLINSEVFRRAGKFNNQYFAYMEDVEFSQRVKYKGYKIVYQPKAIMWHKVSQSSGIGSNLNDYYITRNRLLFGLRYANLKVRILLMKESLKFLINGRHWQRIGVVDYYLSNFGKGSFATTKN